MKNLHYFLQYLFCVIFISITWAVFIVIFDQNPNPFIDNLIVGFALLWCIDKERERKDS